MGQTPNAGYQGSPLRAPVFQNSLDPRQIADLNVLATTSAHLAWRVSTKNVETHVRVRAVQTPNAV